LSNLLTEVAGEVEVEEGDEEVVKITTTDQLLDPVAASFVASPITGPRTAPLARRKATIHPLITAPKLLHLRLPPLLQAPLPPTFFLTRSRRWEMASWIIIYALCSVLRARRIFRRPKTDHGS